MKWGVLRFLTILVLCIGMASGHEMRPAYIEIHERDPGIYDVLWKVPAGGVSQSLDLDLKFSDDVLGDGLAVSGVVSGARIKKWQIKREGGLAGARIWIDGLERSMTDALCRIEFNDGVSLTHRFTPADNSYIVPARPSMWEVFSTYLVLGFEHILLGIDHLLFVLALMLVVRSTKLLVGTITAFTVAHSITLGLASLGMVSLPGAPVEAIIALSIVFVAAEVIRSQQGKPGLTEKAPWLVAFSFGLLHGFGFAGALGEIGLPQSAIPSALLSFNVGVELGQLAFVCVLVLCFKLGRIVLSNPPRWSHSLMPYAIGSIAAFWVIERVISFW